MHHMLQKHVLDMLSAYVPQDNTAERPVERLIKLGEERDRSVNYLVTDAILQYVDRKEKDRKKPLSPRPDGGQGTQAPRSIALRERSQPEPEAAGNDEQGRDLLPCSCSEDHHGAWGIPVRKSGAPRVPFPIAPGLSSAPGPSGSSRP